MKRFGAAFAAAILLIAAFAVPASAQAPFTVVADALQSPRGLTFGPGGRLYVAQAGAGGMSGKITQVLPSRDDVKTGLISVGAEGEFIGVDGISALGNGGIYAIMGASNAATGFPSRLGHLLKVSQGGQVRNIANVGDFNYQWSSEHKDLSPRDFPDSNPYGLLALPDRLYVADAGTNTLNLVLPDGTDRILAFFPDNTLADSTPTCVAQGPDGALYIGTLALVDSLVLGPAAVVYRVDPAQANLADPTATPMEVWASGLWPINGCAFGPDGTFYASQLFTNPVLSDPKSDVVKIPFDDPGSHTFLTGGALAFTGGVAVGSDGAVYVSNGTAFVPEGQVVRLTNY